MTPTLDELFAPWLTALGRDYSAYRHHVERLLALCEELAARAGVTLDPVALRVAGVYHDLGIWSDGTFDYLGPSAARPRLAGGQWPRRPHRAGQRHDRAAPQGAPRRPRA